MDKVDILYYMASETDNIDFHGHRPIMMSLDEKVVKGEFFRIFKRHLGAPDFEYKVKENEISFTDGGKWTYNYRLGEFPLDIKRY